MQIAARTNWLTDVPRDVAAAVRTLSSRRRYASGDIVYRAGEESTDLFQVVSGSVHLRESSDEGKEVLLVVYGPGECFGIISALDGGRRPQDAIAAMATELDVLGKTEFESLRMQFPVIDRAILVWAAGRLRDAMRLYHASTFHDVRRRLAGQIDFLLQYNRGDANGRPVESLDLTQELLAASVGASRQAVNKVLQEWADAGVVQYRYGRLDVLDRKLLRELALREAAL